MEHFWQDLRLGVRMLAKHPTLSIVSILTFGLGIGLTTTVFSIVNGVMFKGLPIPDADRVVAVTNTNPSRNIRKMRVSIQDYMVFQERQTVFESFGACSTEAINLAWEGERPERLSAGLCSSSAFDTLRVRPVLGRTVRADENRPGAEPVIILGYDVWRDRFGSSTNILGKTVRANGVTRTIIGVMPKGFAFPAYEKLWIPLTIDPLATKRGAGPSYPLIARLKNGVSIKEAMTQVAAIAAQLEKEYPESNRGIGATVRPYAENFLGSQIYPMLFTMFGAGIGVLLIACVNVANLLLARTSLRTREVAVRIALGASRSRVLSQLLTEALVLAFIGGIVGFCLSAGFMKWFVTAITVDPPPFWITFELDHRVMLFILCITVSASLFAGLFPALQATRSNVSETLKDETRGSTGLRLGRFSTGLVVAEIAVSCGLLFAAGLMIKSIVQLKSIKMPFTTERILTARINLPRLQYPNDAACIKFYEELLPRLQAIPGVEAATLSDGLPAAGNGTVAVQIEGRTYTRDSDYPVVREGDVTPGYFQTFQTKVLQGREFTAADRPESLRVAVANESFVRTFFPGGDALGKRIKKGRHDAAGPWITIIGVVPDMLMEGIGNNDQSPAGYYIPISQSDVTNFVSIGLRTAGDPMAVTPQVRSAVASLNADLAIYDVLSMKDVILRQTWAYTVFGTLYLAFGISALFLAAAGLYGVMSFAVTQRTREIGIRAALGAQGGQLVFLVMKKCILQLAVGLALGFGLAMLAAGPLQPGLYHVGARDPMVSATVTLALAAAGLFASFIPARRATKIDPVVALAAE